MKFLETEIEGVFVVEAEPQRDERGSFARTFCADAFARQGIDFHVEQCNTSFNPTRGTLRGLHYQTAPTPEPKLVRCTRGCVFDVAVDLRPGSATFRTWVSLELSAENLRALYIPADCAHGFLTLEDDCEVFYQMGAAYDAGAARAVRWNDPAFAITWPSAPALISERDAGLPDFVIPEN